MGKRFLMAPSFLRSHFWQERSTVTPASLLEAKRDSVLAYLPCVQVFFFLEISQQGDLYLECIDFLNRNGWETRVF